MVWGDLPILLDIPFKQMFRTQNEDFSGVNDPAEIN
jgi:hypothetical protein